MHSTKELIPRHLQSLCMFLPITNLTPWCRSGCAPLSSSLGMHLSSPTAKYTPKPSTPRARHCESQRLGTLMWRVAGYWRLLRIPVKPLVVRNCRSMTSVELSYHWDSQRHPRLPGCPSHPSHTQFGWLLGSHERILKK